MKVALQCTNQTLEPLVGGCVGVFTRVQVSRLKLVWYWYGYETIVKIVHCYIDASDVIKHSFFLMNLKHLQQHRMEFTCLDIGSIQSYIPIYITILHTTTTNSRTGPMFNGYKFICFSEKPHHTKFFSVEILVFPIPIG